MTTTNPWHVLSKEFNGRQSETLHDWLTHWVFTNDGAALIVERGNNRRAPVSLEEKQEQAVLVLMTKGKWQTTLH